MWVLGSIEGGNSLGAQDHWSYRRPELGKLGRVLPDHQRTHAGALWRSAFGTLSDVVLRLRRDRSAAARRPVRRGDRPDDRRRAAARTWRRRLIRSEERRVGKEGRSWWVPVR